MFSIVALLLLAGACLGLPTEQSDGKIVGGDDADIEDFPHQLSLQVRRAHNCGASIISDRWAVTAAHCVGSDVSRMSLRAGTSQRGFGGSVHQVTQVIPHPLYNPPLSDYDVALLKVDTPFEFGPGVAAIDLPAKDELVVTGTDAQVTGWGAIKEGGFSASHLQVVHVPILSNAECQAAYRPRIITPRMICAGHDKGGKDACQGDSGGPMVAGSKLIGVVSWGRGCARPAYPGVYTRIASVREWIVQHTAV